MGLIGEAAWCLLVIWHLLISKEEVVQGTPKKCVKKDRSTEGRDRNEECFQDDASVLRLSAPSAPRDPVATFPPLFSQVVPIALHPLVRQVMA